MTMAPIIQIDRKIFFAGVRKNFGSLNQGQVDGFNHILEEWERRALTDLRWLAYILASVWHETAFTMQPIVERGSAAYLQGKPYYPWIGRGLIQITWKKNYDKFGIKDPADALAWPVALRVLFDGMIKGMFTGKGLPQYFNDRVNDPRNARRIVNGLDKASEITAHHAKFLGILKLAHAVAAPLPLAEPPTPPEKVGFWRRLLGRKT